MESRDPWLNQGLISLESRSPASFKDSICLRSTVYRGSHLVFHVLFLPPFLAKIGATNTGLVPPCVWFSLGVARPFAHQAGGVHAGAMFLSFQNWELSAVPSPLWKMVSMHKTEDTDILGNFSKVLNNFTDVPKRPKLWSNIPHLLK